MVQEETVSKRKPFIRKIKKTFGFYPTLKEA